MSSSNIEEYIIYLLQKHSTANHKDLILNQIDLRLTRNTP